MERVIVISGGGTGGHLSVAKALMLECNKRAIPCIYIGSTAGQDQRWFAEEKGFKEVHFLPTSGVVNQKGLGFFKALFSQFRSIWKAKKILKNHQAHCVFSVGGYSSAPASFAALLLGIPLFIHEQNAVKGTLNRLLTPFAKAVFGSFRGEGITQTSYPVRDVFFEKQRERQKVKKVLFLGGSQGAVKLNDFALLIAPTLQNLGIEILHQSGDRDFERLNRAYAELGISVKLFAFTEDVASLMQEADLCFMRSGASSVWEACASALPCVYIPYPYAWKNHQESNARYFSEEGLGMLCLQDDLCLETLSKALDLNFEAISKGLKNKIRQGGASEILNLMLGRCSE